MYTWCYHWLTMSKLAHLGDWHASSFLHRELILDQIFEIPGEKASSILGYILTLWLSMLRMTPDLKYKIQSGRLCLDISEHTGSLFPTLSENLLLDLFFIKLKSVTPEKN